MVSQDSVLKSRLYSFYPWPAPTIPCQTKSEQCGVHNAANIATCVRAHINGRAWKELELCALTQVAMIAASCTPPAPVLILSWSVVVVVVGVAALVQLATFYTVPHSPKNVVYFWTVIESNP